MTPLENRNDLESKSSLCDVESGDELKLGQKIKTEIAEPSAKYNLQKSKKEKDSTPSKRSKKKKQKERKKKKSKQEKDSTPSKRSKKKKKKERKKKKSKQEKDSITSKRSKKKKLKERKKKKKKSKKKKKEDNAMSKDSKTKSKENLKSTNQAIEFIAKAVENISKKGQKRKKESDEDLLLIDSKKFKSHQEAANITEEDSLIKNSSKISKTDKKQKNKLVENPTLNEMKSKRSWKCNIKTTKDTAKKDSSQKHRGGLKRKINSESDDFSSFVPISKVNKKRKIINLNLEKVLSVDVHDIEFHICKDFRHTIFEPVKFKDCVQKLAETSKSVYKKMPIDLAKREIFQILYEKLLKHKWGDAAIILESLAYVKWSVKNATFAESLAWETFIFLKVGRELLLNHPCSTSEANLLPIYVRSLKTFGRVLDLSHIAIEDAFYFFAKHDFVKAKERLMSYVVVESRDKYKEKRRQDALKWQSVAEAYLGISDYCKWCCMVPHDGGDTLPNSGDDFNAQKDVVVAGEMMDHFKILWQAEGTWDIVVLKHIEVLLYYYKFDILQENLSDYSLHHKENPNAHRYLYLVLKSYISENDSTKKLRKIALKRLRKVSPSDQLMVDLHSMKLEKAVKKNYGKRKTMIKFLKALRLLTGLLDYPSNIMLVKPWHQLHHGLKSCKEILTKECYFDLVRRLWIKSGRSTWWPQLHFTANQAKRTALHDNQKLVEAKIFVAKTFMGSDCDFCKKVMQMLH